MNDPALVGEISRVEGESRIAGASWYSCSEIHSGISYRFPSGMLIGRNYLTADFLLDSVDVVVFRLAMREGKLGPEFEMIFGILPHCMARMRMPLLMLNQAKWRIEREGAWLKPMARGDRVDPCKVDRLILEVHRKHEQSVRFAMTPIEATTDEPPLLSKPFLPKGKLLDEFGQSAIRRWPGKTSDEEELISRLKDQAASTVDGRWPESYSQWGGWSAKRFEATGFFRCFKDRGRWWLADPDGFAFWSVGPDCVLPDIDSNVSGLEDALLWTPDTRLRLQTVSRSERQGLHINYLGTNFFRAFGDRWIEEWQKIVFSQLREIGFNTVANWSEWKSAKDAVIPYVRHLEYIGTAPVVYRDLPDVFDGRFFEDAKGFADQLVESATDPSCIGYFLMNEPTWGFAAECPAAGMLYTYESGPARERFAEFLEDKYGTAASFSSGWNLGVDFTSIRGGLFSEALGEQAVIDCEEFSTQMIRIFFTTLSESCRRIDPNHLNLGIRFQSIPPPWALEGMQSFDVFSMNCYRERIPSEMIAEIERKLGIPVMIGEWHFGALDAGLPASGIGHVRTQADRGRAYRYYVETAAADPNCVGVHYFTLYDQSAIGRFDGEAYQIGFIDVCHRPYTRLCKAARATHERMYEVADGRRKPYDSPPEYLPKLFV